jgi:integrase
VQHPPTGKGLGTRRESSAAQGGAAADDADTTAARARRPLSTSTKGRYVAHLSTKSNVVPFPLFPTEPLSATVQASQTVKHRRGPCLNRRTGQNGTVYQKQGSVWDPAAFAYGKYYEDTKSGVRRHRTIPLGRCRTKSVAKQKLRTFIAEQKINDAETFHRITAPGLTFEDQAKVWMESLRTRRRRPLKPATIANYEHYLAKRLVPVLGGLPLAEVGNSALRILVDQMSTEKLSAKTIANYVTAAKLVVASAVDAEGEPLYPRKWNDEFIGVPIVEKDKQKRQTVTGEEITDVISRSKGRYLVLFAALAGSGMRIGEGLALKPEDFSSVCRVIHITHAIWRGKDQAPKTPASTRDIDIAEPLAAMLREYIAKIPAAHYLFATASGKPMIQRNVLRMLHSKRKVGFHVFRRFRTSILRKARVPEDLLKLWLGHASKSVTDDYARQLREDLPFRQEWAERAALGFSISKPEDVLPCSTGIVATRNSKAA